MLGTSPDFYDEISFAKFQTKKFHNKSGSFWLFSLLFITSNLIGQLTSKLNQSEPLIQTNKNFENYNH